MTYEKNIGDRGETLAAAYLKNKGYQVLERNYTSRYGELDLILKDSGMVVFAEVKTRTSSAFGRPEESITPAKLERIQKTALLWLQEHPDMPDDWRVDVVAVCLDQDQQVQDMHHFINVY